MRYLGSSFSRRKMLFISIYVALEEKIVLLVSVGVAQHRKQNFLPIHLFDSTAEGYTVKLGMTLKQLIKE